MCFPPGSRWVALAYLCVGKDIRESHLLKFTQKKHGSLAGEAVDYPLKDRETILLCGEICDLLAVTFDDGFSEDPVLIDKVDALFSAWISADTSTEEEEEEEVEAEIETVTEVEADDLNFVVPARREQVLPAAVMRLRPEWLTGAVEQERRDTSTVVTKAELRQWAVYHNLKQTDFLTKKGRHQCPDCGERFIPWVNFKKKPSCLRHIYDTGHGLVTAAPGLDPVPDIGPDPVRDVLPATTSPNLTSFRQGGEGDTGTRPTERQTITTTRGSDRQCGVCKKTFKKARYCQNHMQSTGHITGRHIPAVTPPPPTSDSIILPTQPMAVRLREAEETIAALARRLADLEATTSL